MLKHEGPDVLQQLPQLLEPCLRVLVHFCQRTLPEHEFLDGGERAVFVIGVVNVWGLGEVQLGVRFLPVHGRATVGF